MSDVDLIISVHTTGVKDIANLSASVRNLALGIKGVTVPMRSLDAHTKAVNKALGVTTRGVGQHATALKQLKANQAALSEESKRLRSNIQSYNTAILRAGGPTTKLGKELSSTQNQLRAFSTTLRGLRIRSFGSDLASISLRLQRMGKDAQFVGRSLMINLTAPLLLFARIGLQNLVKVDAALVRLTKVLEGVAMTAEQADRKLGGGLAGSERQAAIEKMVNSFKSLDSALTSLSNKFGVSKDLIVGLATDFAELGVSANENIEALTELTLVTEKLGNMDAAGAQDLSQALYFNSIRALEASGSFDKLTDARDREARAIASAKTQLNMFNNIENVTALTLRDLSDSLPEVGGMAVSFGLSMTEAAALLAPMKAAGLDVGASANSIKVSLQRAISPTKQNSVLLAKLAEQYGVASDTQNIFNQTTKTGLTGLQAIVDVFAKVESSSAGAEGALKLMSEIFEKRQGPRMYIAIQQMAQFNKELNKATRSASSSEGILASVAEGALGKFNQLNKTSLPSVINNFKDIGIIARIATAQAGQMVEGYGKVSAAEIKTAKEVRKAVADVVVQKKQNEGIDIIGTAKTESARAMLVELAGASNAQQVADMELEQSLGSLEVALQKIRNAFKLFAADLMRTLGPTLKSMADKVQSFYESWQALSETTRQNISRLILGFIGFLAILGPIVLGIGTIQASMGVLGRAFTTFLPKLKNVDGGFVGLGESASMARGRIESLYRTIVESNISRSLFRSGLADETTTLADKLLPSASTRAMPSVPFPSLTAPPAAPAAIPAPTRILPSSVRTGADLDKLIRLEQRKMLSHFDPTDVGIARGTLRGPGGRFLPATAGSRAVSAAMAPGGGADFMAAEASLFARLEAAKAASHAKDLAAQQTLHAKKLADVAAENAAKMAGYNSQVAQQAIFHNQNLAHDAVLAANAKKRQILESAGVTSRLGKDASGKAFIQRMYRGVDITDSQAGDLAVRRAPLLRGRLAAQGALQAIPTSKPVNMGKSFIDALRPIKQYRSGVSGARAAMLALQASHASAGASSPKAFAMMSAAMGGFTKNVKLANLAMKILKLTMLSTGIGAIILGIGVAVMLVVKNFGMFKEKAAGPLAILGYAFGIIKKALIEITRPIQDMFAQFSNGEAGVAGSVGGIVNMFKKLVGAVHVVAKGFRYLVDTVIKPYLYGVVNVVMAVVSIFKGNWGDALRFLTAAFARVAEVVVSIFVMLAKVLIKIAAGIAKGIVKLIFEGVNGLIQLILLAIRGLVNLVGKIPFLKGAMDSANNAIKNFGSSVSGAMDTAAGGVNSVIDGIADRVGGGYEAVGNLIKKGLKKGTDLGVKESKHSLQSGKKDIVDTGEEIGEEAGEAIANSTGEGFDDNDPSKKIGEKLKEGIKSAVQELQDYIAGELKNAIGKYVDASTKALEKQRDAALKIYDTQIKTLGKLEKAEESLSKTKEYESNKRRLMDERALAGEQFRRNYALAIYEGRTDDARMLQLEQVVQTKGFNEELNSIETSRAKDLAKENLDALKDAIKEAKDAAQKFFDESITKFQESVETITKFPPVTIEDYRNQVQELYNITNQTATDNGVAFEKMFTDFATTINTKMPNDVVGAFTTNLDALVEVAREKYGLGSDTSENTVIGVTIGMLADIGGVFGDKKQAVVDSFGLVTTGLRDNFKESATAIVKAVNEDFLTPFAEATTKFKDNWEKVYKQAIIDGNRAITDSLRNNVEINKDLFEEMRGHLDQTTLKWLGLKAAAEAAGEAQEAAANAGGGGGGGTGGGTPAGSGLNAGRADVFVNNNASRVARGLKELTYQQFITGSGVVPVPTTRITERRKGGVIPSRAQGQNNGYPEGYIPAPTQEGVPALLHGGEYILNAKAVSRIGIGALNKMNNNLLPRFLKGGVVPGKKGTPSNTRGSADRIEQKQITIKPNMSGNRVVADRVPTITNPSMKTPSADVIDRYFSATQRQMKMSTPLGKARLEREESGYVAPKYDWTNMTKFGMGGLTIAADLIATRFGGPIAGAVATAATYNLTNRFGNYLASTGAAPGFKGDTSLKGSLALGGLSLAGYGVAKVLGKAPGVANNIFRKYLPTEETYNAGKSYQKGFIDWANTHAVPKAGAGWEDAQELYVQTMKSKEYKYLAKQVENYEIMPKRLEYAKRYMALSGLGEPVRRALEYIPGIKSPSQNVRNSDYNSKDFAFMESESTTDAEWLNSAFDYKSKNWVVLNNLSEILAHHKNKLTIYDGLPSAAVLPKKALPIAAKAWASALNLKAEVIRGKTYPTSLADDYDGIFRSAFRDTHPSDGLGVAVYPYIDNDGSVAHARPFRFYDDDYNYKPRMVTGMGFNWNRTMSGFHALMLGVETAVPSAISSIGAKAAELISRVPSLMPGAGLGSSKTPALYGDSQDFALAQQLGMLMGYASDPVGAYVQVAMHELGHVLNLDHPHEYEVNRGKIGYNSIMDYESGFSNRKLLPGDIAGLKAMLGRQDNSNAIKIPRYKGDFIPRYKMGGYVPGSPSMAVPAILHGGEYVVNADAVRNMGIRTMQSINQSKFRAPSGAPSYSGGGGSTNVSTVNINVDTFIGEEEWFKSMMKDYNVNVLPRQQKAAGMETRTFTSYNGINQGL